MGPRQPRSTVLTEAEEAIVVEFRRRTLLPLDDVMGCLRDVIPRLSRSALHRGLVRHGLSRLHRDEETTSKRKQFVLLSEFADLVRDTDRSALPDGIAGATLCDDGVLVGFGGPLLTAPLFDLGHPGQPRATHPVQASR